MKRDAFHSYAIEVRVAREAVLIQLVDQLSEQRQQAILWIPVLLGIGIWGYFELSHEPTVNMFWISAGLSAILLCFGMVSRSMMGIATACIGFVLLGFVLASIRAHSVAGPVLGWRYYGPVEGQVVAIDRSSSS